MLVMSPFPMEGKMSDLLKKLLKNKWAVLFWVVAAITAITMLMISGNGYPEEAELHAQATTKSCDPQGAADFINHSETGIVDLAPGTQVTMTGMLQIGQSDLPTVI